MTDVMAPNPTPASPMPSHASRGFSAASVAPPLIASAPSTMFATASSGSSHRPRARNAASYARTRPVAMVMAPTPIPSPTSSPASFTSESLAAGGVRLTLTIGLSVLVFRGKKWAYQITIALALAAVLWSGQLALVRGPASLVAGGIYGAVLLLLLLPRTRDYLEAKRWKHLDAD